MSDLNKLLPTILLVAMMSLLWTGCGSDRSIPNVTEEVVDYDLFHFEDLLQSLDTTDLVGAIDSLLDDHNSFAEVFLYQIIYDPSYKEDIYTLTKHFLQDSLIQDLHAFVQQEYEDFASIQREFKQAFQFFHHYFPFSPVPDIYTCVTGFEVGAFTIGEEMIGVGLEFFLGETFDGYDPQLFPLYIQRTMNREHLVPKSIQALVENYVGEVKGNRLIDHMIRNGKVLYIKEKLLPHHDSKIVHEFEDDPMAWVEENEGQIWAYLLDEQLLYDINYRKFQKLVTPSPNVPGMPEQAPGRVANWIGARIVAAYMDRNKPLTFRSLLEEHDSQKILAESKYKPRL